MLDYMIHSDFDVGDSVGCLRYYAGWADKIVGQVSSSVPFACIYHRAPIFLHPLPASPCPSRSRSFPAFPETSSMRDVVDGPKCKEKSIEC